MKMIRNHICDTELGINFLEKKNKIMRNENSEETKFLKTNISIQVGHL